MGARRTARERALQALYHLEMTPASPTQALDAAGAAEPEVGSMDAEGRKFALELIQGVRDRLPELDGLIQQHSHHWRIDRMSRIDRNVLRLGAYELKYRPEIPLKVSINEAVELGKRFGTEESSAFVNGLLDRIGTALGKA
ncbi:MAG TPA: transcription antitermination factor NusB [Myxococcaceae bacterium]|nr:transcription antitermination factor NusB [Myxococcaceae bacterium]